MPVLFWPLTPITKSKEDNKYHVEADLAITPPILLKPLFETLGEIVTICGSRLIHILSSPLYPDTCWSPIQRQPLHQPHCEGRRNQGVSLWQKDKPQQP